MPLAVLLLIIFFTNLAGFMLEPVNGIAKRWQVVMERPIARGADPCPKNFNLKANHLKIDRVERIIIIKTAIYTYLQFSLLHMAHTQHYVVVCKKIWAKHNLHSESRILRDVNWIETLVKLKNWLICFAFCYKLDNKLFRSDITSLNFSPHVFHFV